MQFLRDQGSVGLNSSKEEGLDKYGKSYLVNIILSAVFIVSGLYLAQLYLMEFPDPQLHWEGIVPLIICLLYYLFF